MISYNKEKNVSWGAKTRHTKKYTINIILKNFLSTLKTKKVSYETKKGSGSSQRILNLF